MTHSSIALRSSLFAFVVAGAGMAGSAAFACPDWAQTGAQISYTSDQLWVPQTLSVVAGGGNDLSRCPQPGNGWVATRPDFDLSFQANGAMRDLEIRVNASCDSVLLVNDASGHWYFDDDGGEGFNSTLRIPNAPEGAYDIWVGTYGSATCSATMTLETFNGTGTGGTGVMPQATASCPNPSLNGQMVSFLAPALAMGEQRMGIVAGGNVNLGGCSTVPGTGYVIEGPDVTMDLSVPDQSTYDLQLSTIGDGCDTVLLVHDAAGQWHYNDDDGGLTSRVGIQSVASGEIDIWVGTYGPSTCQTTLAAQAFDVTPQQPVAADTLAPAQETAPTAPAAPEAPASGSSDGK